MIICLVLLLLMIFCAVLWILFGWVSLWFISVLSFFWLGLINLMLLIVSAVFNVLLELLMMQWIFCFCAVEISWVNFFSFIFGGRFLFMIRMVLDLIFRICFLSWWNLFLFNVAFGIIKWYCLLFVFICMCKFCWV